MVSRDLAREAEPEARNLIHRRAGFPIRRSKAHTRRLIAVQAAGLDLAQCAKIARRDGIAAAGRSIPRATLEAVGREFMKVPFWVDEIMPTARRPQASAWYRKFEVAGVLDWVTFSANGLGLPQHTLPFAMFDQCATREIVEAVREHVTGPFRWWFEANPSTHVHVIALGQMGLAHNPPDVHIESVWGLDTLAPYSLKARHPETYRAVGTVVIARAIAGHLGVRLPHTSGVIG